MYNEIFDYVIKTLGDKDYVTKAGTKFKFRKRSDHCKRVFMWVKRLLKDYENAAADYKRATAFDQKNEKLYFLAGKLYLQMDQDEDAIDKRHNIYYDESTGTMAAVIYFKEAGGPKVISVDGSKSIQEVTEGIMAEL